MKSHRGFVNLLVPISSMCMLGRYEVFGNETHIDGNSGIKLVLYFSKQLCCFM
jgi:hypothetical protein